MPMPSSQQHNTPLYSSPKRKRADSSTESTFPVFAPRLDTSFTGTISPTPDSPRSKVAQQFSDLELREQDDRVRNLEVDVSGAGKFTPSKRAKSEGEGSLALTAESKDIEMREIPETPQQPSTGHRLPVTPVYEVTSVIPETPQISFSTESSGPSSAPADSSLLDPGRLSVRDIAPSNTPPPRQHSASPQQPLFNIFWQDCEITGHLGEDPDDDGFGINGVGFKPTPAIAYARTQRRKQQVTDWKAREAKEARQRRSDRRRGEASTGKQNDEISKRIVRFA